MYMNIARGLLLVGQEHPNEYCLTSSPCWAKHVINTARVPPLVGQEHPNIVLPESLPLLGENI